MVSVFGLIAKEHHVKESGAGALEGLSVAATAKSRSRENNHDCKRVWTSRKWSGVVHDSTVYLFVFVSSRSSLFTR